MWHLNRDIRRRQPRWNDAKTTTISNTSQSMMMGRRMMTSLSHLQTMSLEVILLVMVAYVLAEFTSPSSHHRKLSIYQDHCAYILAITSVSPWLVSSTFSMLKNRNLRLLCILEWVHSVCAGLHHMLEHDIFVSIAGIIFICWPAVMVWQKIHDLKSRDRSRGVSSINCMHLSIASTVLYMYLWSEYGEVYILSGAGPMVSLAPVFYVLFHAGEMKLADYINVTFLGVLFIAENLTNMMGEGVAMMSGETTSQFLHFVGHIGISYFLHDLNQRHFFTMKKCI